MSVRNRDRRLDALRALASDPQAAPAERELAAQRAQSLEFDQHVTEAMEMSK